MRNTKIVATIGPAWDDEEKVERMLRAGVNVVRFNMKHADVEWHSQRMELVERVCKKLKMRVAILMDLQGPEVRVNDVPEQYALVDEGDEVVFTGPNMGGIGLDHKEILHEVEVGQTIYVDDGFVELEVVKVDEEKIRAQVVAGGAIKPRKTVNFPGMKLDFPTLVERDLEHLTLVARHHVDWVALSFVRKASDIEQLRHELRKFEITPWVMAKIEHPEAVEHFEEIMAAADGVMVARGDLGVEYALEEVPGLQRMMVKRARHMGKPVIIATQMLESMITNPRPTRAEVSDVATAAYEEVDAVMLSAESAAGKYPIRAVQTMARILERAEKDVEYSELAPMEENREIGQGIVAAAKTLLTTSFGKDVTMRGIVVLSDTGRTARLLARMRPQLPIYALARDVQVLDTLCVSWGVVPVYYHYEQGDRVDIEAICKKLLLLGLASAGDQFLMIYGETWGKPGMTRVLRVQEIVA